MSTFPGRKEEFEELQFIGAGSAYKRELSTLLATVRLFTDFSPAQIQSLAEHFKAYRVEAGKAIFAEGERSGSLALVVAGQVDIVKEDGQSVRKKVATLGPGTSLGEMSLVDGQPRSAGAIMAKAGSILVLTAEEFKKMQSDRPALACQIALCLARVLSQRLRATTGKLVDHLDSDWHTV